MLDYIKQHGKASEPLFFRVGDVVYQPHGLQTMIDAGGFSGLAVHLSPHAPGGEKVTVADFLLFALDIAEGEEALHRAFLLTDGPRTVLFTGFPEQRPADEVALALGGGFLLALERWPEEEYVHDG